MSFLKSVFFGSQGSYNLLGIPVNFEHSHYSPYNLDNESFISRQALKCLNSNVFRLVTQSYAHVFTHEMSHALMLKFFYGRPPGFYREGICIYTDICMGQTGMPRIENHNWKTTLILMAGPMGNIAFATAKLVAAKVFKNYLTWPIASIFGSGAVIWTLGEIFYAYLSATRKDNGDFGHIASHGKMPLALASTAVVAQCILGIYAAATIPSL